MMHELSTLSFVVIVTNVVIDTVIVHDIVIVHNIVIVTVHHVFIYYYPNGAKH